MISTILLFADFMTLTIQFTNRLQLERQKEESDRLGAQLMGEAGFNSSTSRVGTVLHIPNSPSKTGFSTLPSTELFAAKRPSGFGAEISPP